MYRHVQIDKDDSGVWIVTLDSVDSPVNALSSAIFDEVEDLVGELESSPSAKGLVVMSGKDDTFVAGADLDELAGAGQCDVPAI